MDDDVFDEDCSEMAIISQEWNKVHVAREKDGYVIGATAGQNATIQDGFNNGFRHGMMSSFLLSQIKGILKGILAYSAAYEGHPITDDIVLDAERILQEISKIETNQVAEDFLDMRIKPNSLSSQRDCSNNCVRNGEMHDLSTLSLTEDRSCAMETSEDKSATCGKHCTCYSEDVIMPVGSSEITLNQAKEVLLQCPEISQIVQQCKDVLRRLKWSDTVLDLLL